MRRAKNYYDACSLLPSIADDCKAGYEDRRAEYLAALERIREAVAKDDAERDKPCDCAQCRR
jgi:hypothetical protein